MGNNMDDWMGKNMDGWMIRMIGWEKTGMIKIRMVG